jgi:hypothetical protein
MFLSFLKDVYHIFLKIRKKRRSTADTKSAIEGGVILATGASGRDLAIAADVAPTAAAENANAIIAAI